MRRLLTFLLLGIPWEIFAQNCPLGWQTPLGSNTPVGVAGFYADGTMLGYNAWQVKVTIQSLPDPANSNIAGGYIGPDYPVQNISSELGAAGCALVNITPDGSQNLANEWPSAQGPTNGYYAFTLWAQWDVNGTINGWQNEGVMTAYLINGVWSLNPPPTPPPWTGIYNNSGLWDPVGGNYINNNVVVTVTSNGQPCGNGVTVKLTRTSDGSNVSALTNNGRVEFSPVSQDSYTINISGTVTQGSGQVTYSGGTAITKGNAEVDLGILCDGNGNIVSTSINGVNATGPGSTPTSTNPTQSYWQGIFSALFVPSTTTISNLQNSLVSFSTWGPIGYINTIRDQLSLAADDPDPYWDQGPSLAFPTMDPTTGLLVASTVSRSDSSLSTMWTTSPWSDIRGILGGLVYVMFGLGLLKTIKPRFQL